MPISNQSTLHLENLSLSKITFLLHLFKKKKERKKEKIQTAPLPGNEVIQISKDIVNKVIMKENFQGRRNLRFPCIARHINPTVA